MCGNALVRNLLVRNLVVRNPVGIPIGGDYLIDTLIVERESRCFGREG